jgi:hypothetical protein
MGAERAGESSPARRKTCLLAQIIDRRRKRVFEIRIRPETPTERKAVLQLVQMLGGMEPGPGPADAHAKTSSAPVAESPASTAEDAADAEDIVSIEPSPPSGEPHPGYNAQQVLEALQDFARLNGAAALKQVLDRFGARRVSDLEPEQYGDVMTIARGEEG